MSSALTKFDLRQSILRSALSMVGSLAGDTADTIFQKIDPEISKLFEDRNVLLVDGGIVTYAASGTSVSFTQSLKLHINSKVAGGSPTIIDLGATTRSVSANNRMIYAVIDRVGGTATVTDNAATLPAVTSANQEVVLIAKRVDSGDGSMHIWFRNGGSMSNGASGYMGGGGGHVLDNQFAIVHYTDTSKQLAFDIEGSTGVVTTIQTNSTANRILATPDTSDTFAVLNYAQFLQNKQIGFSVANDATSGTNAGLVSPSTGIVRLTSATLSTVGSIPVGTNGQQVILENLTTNPITLLNNSNIFASVAPNNGTPQDLSNSPLWTGSTYRYQSSPFNVVGSGTFNLNNVHLQLSQSFSASVPTVHGTPTGLTGGGGFMSDNLLYSAVVVTVGGTGVFNLSTVHFQLSQANSPTGNMFVKIYNTSGGLPTTPIVGATSQALNVNTLGTSAGEAIFTFSPTQALNAGTTYAFVFDTSGLSYPVGASVRIYKGSPFDANDNYAFTNNNGANWSTTGESPWITLTTSTVPTGNLVAKVYNTSAGVPTTLIPGAVSNNFNVSALTGSVSENTFTFASPPSLNAGTEYAIVLDPSGVTFPSGTNLEFWYSSTGAQPNSQYNTNSGLAGSWVDSGSIAWSIFNGTSVSSNASILTGSGGNLDIQPDASVTLVYDTVVNFWRVINTPVAQVLAPNFNIADFNDRTKYINFTASGSSTGVSTTLASSSTANRVLTLPDVTGILSTRAGTETLSNKTLDDSNIITVKDSNLTVENAATTSKKFKFSASGISASTTRTFTMPDLDDVLVTRTNAETLSNKRLELSSATDSTTTGSSAIISSNPTTGILRLTNGSLASLAGIAAGDPGQLLVLENNTGNPVSIQDTAPFTIDTIFSSDVPGGPVSGFTGIVGSSFYIGEVFTAGSSGTMNVVTLSVIKGVSLPTGNLYVELWNASAGAPTTLVATSNSIDVSTITATFPNPQDIYLSFAPGVSLVSGQQYAIIPHETNNSDIDWAQHTVGSGGGYVSSANPGGPWTQTHTANFYYQVAHATGAAPTQQIKTGTGAPVQLSNNAQLFLVYDNGFWRIVGGTGGGGAGAKNYLSSVTTSQSNVPNTGNGNFELASTMGWSLAKTSLSGSLYPTSLASAGTPFSSTSGGSAVHGTLSFGTVSSGQLDGLYSGSLADTAAGEAGDMIISDAFYIDNSDKSKILYFSFNYKEVAGTLNLSGTSANSFAVYIYDVTNAAWIQPVGVYNMVRGQGSGVCAGSFQTTSNSIRYQIAVVEINAVGGAFTAYFDDFFVGSANGASSNIVLSQSPTIQRFVSGSGTYTTPFGVQWIKVTMVGGGGGGAGSGTGTSAGPGGAGGSTTFGSSLLTATGGAGGPITGNSNAAGGTATVNSPAATIIAANGSSGTSPWSPTLNLSGGATGGISPFGGAGQGATNSNGGNAVANSGSGGASGGGNASVVNMGYSGPAGAYLQAIITNPLSSYSFSVGGGGGAGSSGTNGQAGGAGGSGVIIVEEFYSAPGAVNGINGSGVIAASATNNSGTHSANGAFQDIATWNAPSVDTYSSFDTSTGTYTIQVSGIYFVESSVAFSSNATGERVAKLVVNGSTQIAWAEIPGSGSFQTNAYVSRVYSFNAGDTVKVQAFQNSGGNLAYGTNVGSTNFGIAYLSGANSTVGLTATKLPPTRQQFSGGSGSYVLPTGPVPLYIRVRMVAGGGGGFGSTNNSAGNPSLTGAGNGGNTTFGSASVSGGNAANGDSFSNSFQAGGLGQGFSLGPYQGWGISGGQGGGNNRTDGGGIPGPGGAGGASFFGGEGQSSGSGDNPGPNGINSNAPGSGGGGAGGWLSAGKRSGAGGGAGGYCEFVISGAQLLNLINSPPSWSVGGGGGGGSFTGGGPAASTGGNGSGGFIVVDEYYQ